MADVSFSELPNAAALNGADFIALSQLITGTFVSGKATLTALKAWLNTISDAPVDGDTYARLNGAWVNIDDKYEPLVQDNLTASVDPTGDDDEADGYAPLSRWFNTTSREIFMCLDATEGAAIWVKTSLSLDELGSMAVVDDAPSDGISYARKDAGWQALGSLAIRDDVEADGITYGRKDGDWVALDFAALLVEAQLWATMGL